MSAPLPVIRDDFAGPGGWDHGLTLLGADGLPHLVGVEHDEAACLTGRAAGHDRFLGDVRDDAGLAAHLGVEPSRVEVRGYIASPPCQTFSAAGGGSGRRHLDRLLAAVHKVAAGATPTDAVASVGDDALDERSVLVLEPLRVIRDHRPRWVALEQVKEVLPVWGAYVDALAGLGYSAWTEVLNAEQYGVPQTRRRAVLVAVRDDVMDEHGLAEVPWPAPTHSRFHTRDRTRLDPDVLPWVSMADALGRAETMRSNYGTGGDPAARGERLAGEPAATVTSKVDRNRWEDAEYDSGQNSYTVGPGAEREQLASEGRWRDMSKPSTRPVSEPAMTVRAVYAGAWRRPDPLPEWTDDRPAKTVTGNSPVMPGPGQAQHNAEREQASGVLVPGWRHPGPDWREGEPWRPTPAMEGDETSTAWTEQRPSPTVVGSFQADVIAAPGYRKAGDPPRQRTPGSVRVSVEEAGVLQSFPVDYPWQGTKTKQFQQVGNAIPPVLAAAVLAPLLPLL